MVLVPMNLRLEAANSAEAEEYRIHDGDIEVRTIRRYAGHGPSEDDWQQLSHNELANHVHDNTVVAQWLRHRIGWRRLLLKCTDQQTLQQFGITANVQDRFAA